MRLIAWIQVQTSAARPRSRGIVIRLFVSACSADSRIERIIPCESADAIVEERTVILKPESPAIAGIFPAELYVMGLIVDGFSQFRDVKTSRAGPEVGAKGSLPFDVLRAIATGEGPSGRRRVSDPESADAVEQAQVDAFCVIVYPVPHCGSVCVRRLGRQRVVSIVHVIGRARRFVVEDVGDLVPFEFEFKESVLAEA